MHYGPQAPMNTTAVTAVATAVQGRWACHTRTVLLADAYGRQRCNVVLSECSVVYLWYMSCGLCARERGHKNRLFLPVRKYQVQNRRHTQTPGKSSYPLPAEKNFGSPPWELQCSARPQTSTTGSGRPSCVDVVIGFWVKGIARTKR